jgi:hypothetical protein
VLDGEHLPRRPTVRPRGAPARHIESIAYAAGDVNPANPCQSGEPTSSSIAWTAAPDGTSCGAGSTCSSGACTGSGSRIKITIDHTRIDADLAHFSVLVHLGASSGRNHDDVSVVFDELAFDAGRKKIAITTADGTTQCYVEIGYWSDADEQAALWVKVPSISSTIDAVLYLYYDRHGVTIPTSATWSGS